MNLMRALEEARRVMYHRTSGYFTIEEQDKIRTWIDATLAQASEQINQAEHTATTTCANVSEITPSQQAKAAGLKSLRELSDISDVSVRTLENWAKHNPQRFAVILAGAVAVKAKGAGNAQD